MAWIGLAAQGVGATINSFAGAKQASDQNKKLKNAMSDYPYTPYSGARPPHIDREGYEYLRPTQDLTQQIITDRAQGKGVGYDPAWLQLNADLINSNVNKNREDSIRDANGRLASSGLSGNARAQEALAGRVNRDSNRQASDAMAALSISDLERKNQERDTNTARLQDLNASNFGQENIGAEFDLNKWKAEESAKEGRVGLGFQYADMYRNPYSVAGSTIGTSLINAGSQMYGGSSGGGGGGGQSSPVQTYSSSAGALNTSGQGLQPTSSYGVNPNAYQQLNSKSQAYKNYMR